MPPCSIFAGEHRNVKATVSEPEGYALYHKRRAFHAFTVNHQIHMVWGEKTADTGIGLIHCFLFPCCLRFVACRPLIKYRRSERPGIARPCLSSPLFVIQRIAAPPRLPPSSTAITWFFTACT